MLKKCLFLYFFLFFVLVSIDVSANTFADNCSTDTTQYYIYESFESGTGTYFNMKANGVRNSTYAYDGTWSLVCGNDGSNNCGYSKQLFDVNTSVLLYVMRESSGVQSVSVTGFGVPNVNYLTIISQTFGGSCASQKWNYYADGACGTYGIGVSRVNTDWDRVYWYQKNSTNTVVNITNSTGATAQLTVGVAGGGSAYTLPSNLSIASAGLASESRIWIDKIMVWNRSIYGDTCPPPPSTIMPVVWVNQTPADITTTNAVAGNLTLLYSITQTGSTKTYINYTVNSTFGAGAYWTLINGSIGKTGYNITDFSVTNVSTAYTFVADADNLFPASYNIPEPTMSSTVHNTLKLSTNNDYLWLRLYNLTTTTNADFLEIMMNNTGTCAIYYCNNTYTAGNPATDTNCVLIANVLTNNGYNHSHGLYSRHNIFSVPVNTTSGKIGTVGFSPTATFLIRGTNAGECDIGTVNITTRTDTTKTSVNGGNAWTNQTYTADAHIHLYSVNDSIFYTACSVNATTTYCASFVTDYFNVTPLPPTSPIIYNPSPNDTLTNFSQTLVISYTPSIAFNNATIIGYNISLLNSAQNWLFDIYQANSSTYSYIWDTVYSKVLSITNYYVKVVVTDSNGLKNRDISTLLYHNFDSQRNFSFWNRTYAVGNQIQTYNITLLDLNDSTTRTFIGVNESNFTPETIKFHTYNMTADFGSAWVLYKYQFYVDNRTWNFTNLYINLTNSIDIWIYNQSSPFALANNANLSITLINSAGGIYSSNITTTGNLYLSGIPVDTYQILISDLGTAYSSGSYYFTVIDRGTQTVKIYLLDNAVSCNIAVFTKSESALAIPNAEITFQVLNGSIWLTANQYKTDDAGQTLIPMENGNYYKLIIDATPTYSLKEFAQLYYCANSPYTFYLAGGNISIYSHSYRYISWYATPSSNQIGKNMTPFTFVTYSNASIIEYFGMSFNNNLSNSSASSSGGTVSFSYDFTAFPNSTAKIYYFYKLTGYPLERWTITYLVSNYTKYNTTNIIDATETFKTDANPAWQVIIAMFGVVAIGALLIQLTGNPFVTTIGATGTLIFFAYIGYVNPILTGFIVAVIGMLYFFTGGRL